MRNGPSVVGKPESLRLELSGLKLSGWEPNGGELSITERPIGGVRADDNAVQPLLYGLVGANQYVLHASEMQ